MCLFDKVKLEAHCVRELGTARQDKNPTRSDLLWSTDKKPFNEWKGFNTFTISRYKACESGRLASSGILDGSLNYLASLVELISYFKLIRTRHSVVILYGSPTNWNCIDHLWAVTTRIDYIIDIGLKDFDYRLFCVGWTVTCPGTWSIVGKDYIYKEFTCRYLSN